MVKSEPSLKRLQQRLRLALSLYTDLTEATYEIMMTFKSIPLTAKDRAQFLIQRRYDKTAQPAFIKARNALMVTLAVRA